jgi:uroporphyrinogen decarboxylase
MNSMNSRLWIQTLPSLHRPLPILSFPAVHLLGVTVRQFTHDAVLQARGIRKVAERVPSAAAVTAMDLSVEAEAFGCRVQAGDDDIPTIAGTRVPDAEAADALSVPDVGDARTGLYIDAARRAKAAVSDRPVLAGLIGPYSLAGRLMDVAEALANCLAEPGLVHAVMRKSTDFLIAYARAYKAAGLDGMMMAEPLAGLLSPALEREFSAPYVAELVEAVQDDGFVVIYHNCGPNTPHMLDSLAANGAAAYHFGDAVDLAGILARMPTDKPICGNVSPSAHFLGGTPASVREATLALLEPCASDPRFVLSSGCDIPPGSPWENIDAFFQASRAFYGA